MGVQYKSGNNVQTSQMLMTTHSQYVLKSALFDKHNTAVFLMKNNGNVFSVNKMATPFVLSAFTTAELNYEAFNIASREYHNELYGYMQILFKAGTVKKLMRLYLTVCCLIQPDMVRVRNISSIAIRLKPHILKTL